MEELTDDEDFLEFVLMNAYFTRPPVFRENRPNHFEKWNDSEFKKRFRLSKDTVKYVIDQIADDIASPTNRNRALTPTEMVFITLRFLATGFILQETGDFGVNRSTASRVVNKVSQAIARRRKHFINMPNTVEDINQVQQNFYNISHFPRCIGAIDCTHVKIQSPGGSEAENYRNRKRFFSYNCQVICDSELRIQDIVCRPGSYDDSLIFQHTRISTRLESGDFGDNILLGDNGYEIKPYLITPLLNPQTPAEHLFNESLIRTRNPIERCFEVWKRRFPVLALGIRLKLKTVEKVVITSAILHNIALERNDALPPTNKEIETAINNVKIPNNIAEQNQTDVNETVRHALITDCFQNLL